MQTETSNGVQAKMGYDEQHQFNVRAIYALENIADIGVSLQYGLLKGTNVGNDDSGNHYAFSAHAKNTFADFHALFTILLLRT